MSKRAKKVRGLVDAANFLSIGISVVVAVLLGVGLGLALAKIYKPLFFLGAALGVAAAVLNVYKAYKLLLRINEEEEK